MTIAAILFDKDGTLFDFRKSWAAWAEAVLAALGQGAVHRASLAAAIGYLPDSQDFAPDSLVIAGTAAEVAACLLPHLPGRAPDELITQINQMASLAPMVPALPLRPLLQDLRLRGLRIGLATNDGEAPARAHLAAHDLSDLFDFVAGYDSGYGGKPGAGMCLAFAQTCGLAPAQVVMVGDSLHDLHAGRAAGMRCLAVLTGIATAPTLAPHADAVLPDIGAIGAWLDGQASTAS